MSLFASMRRRRLSVEQRLERAERLHTLSAARLSLKTSVEAALTRYASGRALEAGAGRSPYGSLLKTLASDVTTLDIDTSRGRVDIVADVQDMPMVPSSAFDTVVCTQVLEHIPRPTDAMREISRVLRPGGVLILSAPHLSMVHEAPTDFYRYTRYGLTYLSEQAGLEVLSVEAAGGLVTFLLHTVSIGLITTIGSLPLLFWPTWLVNYLLFVRLGLLLDRLIGLPSLFGRDHVIVARKP